MNAKTKSRRRPKSAGRSSSQKQIIVDPQCSRCIPAKCCEYFSLEIDRPRSKRDYNDLLWFLAHDNVSIYIWEKSWYLMVHNRCRFLNKKSNLCEIYDERPKICREHTTDECEFDSEYEFDEHFKTYEDLKRWMKKNKKT
jgi:hypothetical protein